MRKLIIALCVMAAVVYAGSEGSVVATVNENTGVYEHVTRVLYEAPLFTVDKGTRLKVLAQEGRFMKVQDSNGDMGWIEKRLTKKVASRGFVFENTNVLGYLDNPDMTVIWGKDDSPEDAIRLTRSFKACLAENLDRETADRIVK